MSKIIIIVSLCLFTLPALPYSNKTAAESEQRFIDKMVTKYHFKRDYITKLIHGVKILPKPIQRIKHPFRENPWYIYREAFVNDNRIKTGINYWQQHAEILSRAEKEYGVPASIIVALVGVESNYGRNQGNFPTLNTLVTLAFFAARQTDFFAYELGQFFLLTRELLLDPLKVRGSYGGALGYPQFMPSAYRLYAVDFDGDGKKDLSHDTSDVIGSIANFVKHKGWREHEPIAVQAKITGDKYKKILNEELKTKFTVAELKKYGIQPIKKLPDNTQVNLIRLKIRQGYEYWLGLHNFYVLTHYNVSTLYAMAIYQLAEKIKNLHYNKQHVQKRVKISSSRRNRTSRKSVSTNSAKRT